MTVADQQHWLSRLRGGPQESTTGFYLTGKTGRLRAAEHLAGWMTDPPKRPGSSHRQPGYGQIGPAGPASAANRTVPAADLLRARSPVPSSSARLACFPPTLPSSPSTPVASTPTRLRLPSREYWAGRRTASGCWKPRRHPQQDRRVMVVDAVDEAISPATLLGGLLVPLARQPGMRVAVGARRHVLAGAGEADLTIDLDTATTVTRRR